MIKEIHELLIEAAKDYKYLLNRGYPQKSSLDLVISRYRLSKYERLLLYRCVHSDDLCRIIKGKKVHPSDIKNQLLIIDGYNVLLTILTGIKREPLYLCDDGFLRDLRGAQPRSCEYDLLTQVAEFIKYSITKLKPRKVIIILDENVSRSKVHSEMLKQKIESKEYELEVKLCKKADKEALTIKEGIVSSSDIVILQHAEKVFDLAAFVINELKKRNFHIELYELKI